MEKVVKEPVVKPPKVPKIRVTNKMIEVLAEPEIRSVCITLLNIDVILAWRAGAKERVKWFVEHLDVFATADLEQLNWSLFRHPAKQFLYELQQYVKGTGPVPVLSTIVAAPEIPQVKYIDPDIWARDEEEIEEDDATDTEIVTPVAVSVIPATEPVQTKEPQMAEPTSRFKKMTPPNVQDATVTPAPAAPSTEVLDSINTLITKLEGIAAKQAEQDKVISDIKQALEDYEPALIQLTDGVVFMINNGFMQGNDQIETLAEVAPETLKQ